MSESLLRVDALAVAFGEREALTDVSFTVEHGSCVALVGETGSGKSLTCRTLIGLEPRLGARIVRGSVSFEGEDLSGLGARAWRDVRGCGIALVPQASLSSMDPVRRVGSQLEEAIRSLDPDADPKARALELMDQVDMPRPAETLRSHPHQLSGGMRQRAMIALALVGRPRLLLADEPTTALDVTVQRKILRLLAEIREQTGMALLFITHDLGVVRSIADRVTILYAGKTVESGPLDEVFSAPAHPYTRALLAAQPGSADRSQPLAAIAGGPPPIGERPRGCPFVPRCPEAVERCNLECPELAASGDGEREVACIRAVLEPR